MFRMIIAAVFLAAAAGVAQARDMALVIANNKYARINNSGIDKNVNRAIRALNTAGFSVDQFRNLDARQLQRAAEGFASRIDDDVDRVVIFVSGHFVSSENDGWVLGDQALAPSSLTIGSQGVSLNALADVLALRPAQALLVVATSNYAAKTGRGLVAGDRPRPLPQGVTGVSGPIGLVVRHLAGDLLAEGVTLADAQRSLPAGVTMTGLVSDRISFTPRMAQVVPPPPPVDSGEQAYWNAARDIGTVEALQAYLRRYPDGEFSAAARNAIRAVQEAPLRRAEADEERLNLSRNDRRDIQRDLTLLGFDTRGVDGVLGRGSRAAISAWQKSRGLDETGFMNRAQIDLLHETARLRREELAEEAERVKEAREQEDREYWRQTGRGRDEAGLRAYLRRYPNGLFSDVAKERMAGYESDRQRELEAADRAAWDNAEILNNEASYRGYLESYPKGLFAEEARQRIRDLTKDSATKEQIALAKRQEQTAASNPIRRALVEQRLAQLGFNPGTPDGRFTDRTRQALRAYQESRNLLVTGYVDKNTVNALLSGR